MSCGRVAWHALYNMATNKTRCEGVSYFGATK